MRRSAFVWWQMLIGVGAIAGLAAVLFPVSSRCGNNNPHRTACQSNLKQIGLAVMQYMADNNENYPRVRSGGRGWVDKLQPYLKNTQVYYCPAVKSGKGKTDYFYNARLSGQSAQLLNFPANTIMTGDGLGGASSYANLSQLPASWASDSKSPAHRHLDGANYGYADGHVKWLKPEKVTNEKADSAGSSFAPW